MSIRSRWEAKRVRCWCEIESTYSYVSDAGKYRVLCLMNRGVIWGQWGRIALLTNCKECNQSRVYQCCVSIEFECVRSEWLTGNLWALLLCSGSFALILLSIEITSPQIALVIIRFCNVNSLQTPPLSSIHRFHCASKIQLHSFDLRSNSSW